MKKLLCAILALALTFSVAGCAGAAPETKPDEAVKGFFEAAKQFDFAAMNKFVNPDKPIDESSLNMEDESEKAFVDYFKENAKKITYSIKGSEVSGDTATVTVDCKYIDGATLFQDVMTEYMEKAMEDALNGKEISEEEATSQMMQLLKDKQASAEPTYIETTIPLKCVKINNQWYIEDVGTEIENMITSNFANMSGEAGGDSESTDEAE